MLVSFRQTYDNRKILLDIYLKDKRLHELLNLCDLNLFSFHNVPSNIIEYFKENNPVKGEILIFNNVTYTQTIKNLIQKLENINCTHFLFTQDDTFSKYNIEPPDEFFNEKYVSIYDLKTFEQFRGKGYAKLLLNKIFNYVKNRLKLNIITLIVDKDNYKAVNLYFKTGFEIFIEYNDSYSLIKRL